MQLEALFPFSKVGISGINQMGGNYMENPANPKLCVMGGFFRQSHFCTDSSVARCIKVCCKELAAGVDVKSERCEGFKQKHLCLQPGQAERVVLGKVISGAAGNSSG